MQAVMLEKIDREAANMAAGKPARIIAKLNGLLEPAIVQALYRASQAGVPMHFVCRGICALRPGLPEVSETIRVTSVVDRFLEHSRIFYFENAGEPDVYIGSADWMDRNLSRRVEVIFPIEQADLKARLIDEILMTSLNDTAKARELKSDGTYVRLKPENGVAPLRSQQRFLELAAESEQRLLGAAAPLSTTVPVPTAKPKVVKPRKKSA
jgi:polyphosphate kinase